MVFTIADPVEVAISSDPAASDARVLLEVIRAGYRPFAVVAAGISEGSQVPLLLDRPMRDERATAYVCRQFACRAPVVEPAQLASELASGS